MVPGSVRNWIAVNAVQKDHLNEKQRNNSIRAWALHVALSIALLSISAVLVASSFKAAPATSGLSVLKPATQARTLSFPAIVLGTSALLKKFTGDIGPGRMQMAAESHRSIS